MSEADDLDFDFTREGEPGCVWVQIILRYGITLVAYSDEPTSPREWTLDEGEILFDHRQDSLVLREVAVPSSRTLAVRSRPPGTGT